MLAVFQQDVAGIRKEYSNFKKIITILHMSLERCKSWNPKWTSLEKPPRKSQRKSLQTLDAQAENTRKYCVL